MTWIEIKALHELYSKGCVAKNRTLAGSGEFRYLHNSLHVLDENYRQYTALPGFTELYEHKYLAAHDRYRQFLLSLDLLKPQTRFEAKDMDILIYVKGGIDSGELASLKKQIIEAEESRRGVSRMFFKHEKYLDTKESLTEALKKILQVPEFADDRDQQYMYRLECPAPKLIVLCENLDFLLRPSRPRRYGIELWYAGGKNIEKLNYVDTRQLPIYYSCDWDYDGLLIYQAVKRIIPGIELLMPTGTSASIVESEHRSLWTYQEQPDVLSGLDTSLFNPPQANLIRQLIFNNSWIIEESNDLIAMVKNTEIASDL